MNQKTFRLLMFLLAAFAVFALLALLFVLALRPKGCSVPRCRDSSVFSSKDEKTPPAKYVVYDKTAQGPPDSVETRERQNDASLRDRRVLNDPLYPPTNRTSEDVHRGVTAQIRSGNLYQNVDDTNDGFRLVGYLTSNEHVRDAGGNSWQLFARMKDRHQGEYYIVPTNRNMDLKVPLTPDVVVGERLRDVYTLPNEMRFRSPMLNEGSYRFTELPKAELGSTRYI